MSRVLTRPPEGTPKLYSQDGLGYRAQVWAHYFAGGSDWLVTEYDPVADLAFGWVCLNGDRRNAELGYFSLAEMEAVEVVRSTPGGLLVVIVDHDDHWQPRALETAIAEIDSRQGVAGG
jgi:hypothetical protein